MSHTIMLYGAAGFSGRLIAAEGRRRGMATDGGTLGPRMILAGRDGRALARLARDLGMPFRVFGLEDRAEVKRGLREVDVLINAASPFAYTAERLSLGAVDARCHYVDINGALDVYLDIQGRVEEATLVTAGKASVRSAGFTAAASDLLLTAALNELTASKAEWGTSLGSVRIALACPVDISRGHAEILWHAVSDTVSVVREDEIRHVKVGRLEHTFNFKACRHAGGSVEPDSVCGHADEPSERDLRAGSAANLVDTRTAQATVRRKKYSVKTIESYVAVGPVSRIAYQLGALLTPITRATPVQRIAEQQIKLLPPGPSSQELDSEGAMVLLQIEDPVRTPIVDWLWETPNTYRFTAQVVVEVAARVAVKGLSGFVSPGAILDPQKADLNPIRFPGDPTPPPGELHQALRRCTLQDRLAMRQRRP
jgi:short subunit dehydrogenase-like uncharacterized protein